MKLYRIRNWNVLFENNRTRELKKLDWLPVPNKQDGDGYTTIMSDKDGAAIFGAWIACAQIASRCEPRGTLLRDGKKPHDAASLSRMSRIPIGIIQKMLNTISSNDVNWLEVIELKDACDNPAQHCDIPALGCLEGKGREGTEENGKEENNKEASPHAIRVFQKPDLETVSLAMTKAGAPDTEAEKFIHFYESKGWKVGKTQMVSWQGALGGWVARWREKQFASTGLKPDHSKGF